MPQRPGLGKGLDALIPSSNTQQPQPLAREGGVLNLPIDSIKRNPRQPRGSDFDEKDFQELAASISEHGIIQPLVVSYSPVEDCVLSSFFFLVFSHAACPITGSFLFCRE